MWSVHFKYVLHIWFIALELGASNLYISEACRAKSGWACDAHLQKKSRRIVGETSSFLIATTLRRLALIDSFPFTYQSIHTDFRHNRLIHLVISSS
ncbi:hypothetical protein F5Y04DRAFT_56356 [Hypomontagnella monticulosa]|nr:hypothetical protein F5Y04DRAFT_56356 [Hypomontagnella monticulosa]